jgi:serine/threonine protein kinase
LKQKLGVANDERARLLIDSTVSEEGYDLIERMMRWDPKERITAAAAIDHPWFKEVPIAREGCFMPQLPRN